MATANPLENEITCCICHSVYDDPHILRECLHTYCLRCIEQIRQGGLVQCPLCRRFNHMGHIKQDFNKQSLIDLHNKQRKQRSEAGCKCEMCQIVAACLSHHCEDCDIFLCSGCVQGHQTNRTLQSHKLTPISERFKGFETNCSATVCKLEKEVRYIDQELRNIATSKSVVQFSNDRQMEKIRNITQEVINDIKANEKRLESLVNDANQDLLAELSKSQTLFEQCKQEHCAKITTLKKLLQNRSIQNLQGRNKRINETIKQQIAKTHQQNKKLKTELKSPVTVQKGTKWNVNDSIEINIDKECSNSPGQSTIGILYTNLYKKTFHNIQSTILEHMPKRLTLIDNQIWCTCVGGLYIFNTDCYLVNEIRNDKISRAKNVVMTSDSGHLIVACWGDQGLQMLTKNGDYIKQIAKGSYSDVAYYNGSVYGLEYKTRKVIVLRNDAQNEWPVVQQYKLEHLMDTGDTDKLVVNSSGIYVSSWKSHVINVYTTLGDFKLQTGEEGKVKAGQFYHPSVCDVDSMGNMLVADRNNRRLQVYNSCTGEWNVVPLLGWELKYTQDAAVDKVRGEIWLITNFPHALEKFKFQ